MLLMTVEDDINVQRVIITLCLVRRHRMLEGLIITHLHRSRLTQGAVLGRALQLLGQSLR